MSKKTTTPNTVPYVMVVDSYVTAYINGFALTAFADHPKFEEIKQALQSGQIDGIESLFSVVRGLASALDSDNANEDGIQYDSLTGTLTHNGRAIDGVVCERLITLYKNGITAPAKKLSAFLNNLYENPNPKVVARLYTFLEKGEMPITEDGYFLAYKRIRHNWKDCYTGTIDNSVGVVVSMPREQVNDNDEQTCSSGLHFCSYSYLKSYGGDRIVLLKVNPRDVVSIPVDYNDAKGRACEYLVLKEVTNSAESGPIFTADAPLVTAAGDAVAADKKAVIVNQPPSSDTNAFRLRKLTLAELAELWNTLALPHNKVKIIRFSDKPTGIHRITSTFSSSLIQKAIKALRF